MRFVVVGAGAVGGVVGGRLAQAGHEVALVARGAHLEALRRDDLRLRSPDDDEVLRLPAGADPSEVGLGEGDVVLLAVKTQDSAAALARLALVAPPATPIVCLQNGVENERLALRRFAEVVACCVMLPATHLEPGVVVAQSAPTTGLLDVGRYPDGTSDAAAAVAEAFRGATFGSEVRPDVMRWKRTKLLMNLGNAVQALCGTLHDEAGELVRLARAEAEACYAAAGLAWASAEEDRERRAGHLEIRPVDGVERGGGSTWQSLQRGQGSVEAAYLNGEVALLGRLHGVPTPVNALLAERCEAAAAQGLRPGDVAAADLLAICRE